MQTQKTYQLKHSGPNAFPVKGPQKPKWYIVDANGQVVGRLASVIAKIITGKHKPTYTRHADAGDFVVVINAEKIVFTRGKIDKKIYYDYSGYLAGLKARTARDLMKKHPDDILWRAVWGMTSRSTLARRQIRKLKIYAGAKHPHEAQNPVSLTKSIVWRTPVK